MKIITFLILLQFQIVLSQNNFEKTWATYYNDGHCYLGTSAIDKDGNIYMVGSVKEQSVFMPSNDAFQIIFGGGNSDGFITKFSPNGEVVWATFFGGVGDDVLESITIDGNNNLYATGLTNGSNNLSTPNSFRETLSNTPSSFFVKFNQYGELIWSSYYTEISNESFISPSGNNLLSETGSVFYNNNIYFYSLINETNQGTQNVFQTNKETADYLISKFDLDGNRIWSTYYGVNESYISGITVNQSGLYICGRSSSCLSSSTGYFATNNCFQSESFNECGTPFISKFNLNGQRDWSTYFGGNLLQDDIIYKNSIKSYGDSVYFTGISSREDLTTSGSFQEYKDYYYGNYLTKFNSLGERIWTSFLGLNPVDDYYAEQRSLQVDSNGNVFIAGVTNLQNNISTSNTFQNNLNPFQSSVDFKTDAYVMKFNENGEKIWGTYFGGTNDEYFSEILPFENSFYLYGITRSTSNISTVNSFQPSFNSNGIVSNYDSNIFLARFDPNNLSNYEFFSSSIKIYPNPAQNYFMISALKENLQIEIFDLLGKKIHIQKTTDLDTKIETSLFSTGVYLVKIEDEENQLITRKLVIE